MSATGNETGDRRARWPEGPARGALAAIALLHVGLALWAAGAWRSGPFGGRAILDGFEVLELARTGSTGALATKSPLYPALLRAGLGTGWPAPDVIAGLGLVVSLSTLAGVAVLARRVTGQPWAAPLAALGWTLSGSAYAFLVQPLPVGLATALLTGAAILLASTAAPRLVRPLGAGALGAAAAFTRAPLALFVVLASAWLLVRHGRRRAGAYALGALGVTLAAFALFGRDAWPRGGALNLRMGNGAERSGISDVRPGPAYDRVRYAGTFEALDDAGRARSSDEVQLARLSEEVARDPLGALGTLGRKAWLFGHRTETHTAADFRHGLLDLPWFPLALGSWGLLFPLALAARRTWREPALWLPLVAVFVANVLWLTSARYRFPALPFVCVGAAAFLTTDLRSPRRTVAVARAALAGLVFVPVWTSQPLRFPGDGLVQEAHARMAEEPTPERARVALERALEVGADPRAAYDLALWHERSAATAPDPRAALERAIDLYARALELDPLYAQAAENRMRCLIVAGRTDAARRFGRETIERNPYAGFAWLNLAELDRERRPPADARRLRARGHAILALRRRAQGALEAAREHAAEARRLGTDDARIAALFPVDAEGDVSRRP